MNFIKKLFIITFLTSIISLSASYIIDQPGTYEIGGDLIDIGTDVIIIQANNVDLDLGGKIIAGGLNGIKIKPGFANIRIKNGFISNIVNSGISIEENVIGVQIWGVGIAQCGGRGIEVLGTDSANLVRNILIDGVNIGACSTSMTSSQVILAQHANNVIIRNSAIFSSGNISNAIDVIKFENSVDCLTLATLIKNNFGAALTGCSLENSKACFFANVDVSTGLALSESFTGFKLNNSSGCGFGFCRVVSSTATAGNATGVEVGNGSSESIFREVNVAALEGGSVFGYHINGMGMPSNTTNNLFAECAVVTCSALSGDATGFFISRADESVIGKCRIVEQRAAGIAAGIRFESGMGGDNWTVLENRMARNIGSSDADSYGVFVETGTNNIFSLNIASNNGDTPSNQFAGVPAGSVSLATQSSINTVSAPWTNLGITP